MSAAAVDVIVTNDTSYNTDTNESFFREMRVVILKCYHMLPHVLTSVSVAAITWMRHFELNRAILPARNGSSRFL